jgi:hypothetical protein
MSTKSLSSHLSDRFRDTLERSRERRAHNQAMTDPRIREEHYIARNREVSAGGQDCPYCA